MTPDLRDTMMLYGVTLGKRRTRREKAAFGTHLAESGLPGWNVTPQVGGKGSFRTVNLIAGDLSRAKTVIAVPYDTPARAIRPCRYYPFHPALTLREERVELFFRFLAAAAILALAYLPILFATTNRGLWWLLLLPAAGLIALAVWVLWGSSNPFNFNRHSASVAVAVRAANALRDTPGVAVAFCDKSAGGYQGYKLLARELPEHADVILLDCVAQGEELVLAYTARSSVSAGRLLTRLPKNTRRREYGEEELERNLLSIFPRGMVLTGGRVEKGELVVTGTRSPKDVGLDLPRLSEIETALVAFASRAGKESDL